MSAQTVSEAKVYIRENFDKGSDCPCCGQLVKLYRRKLTSSMAFGLYELYKLDTPNFIHVENFFKEKQGLPSSIRGDFSKLRYWKLIEKKQESRLDGSCRNGYYRITALGKEFIQGKRTVSTHVFLFNNKMQGATETRTTFKQSLGKKFNYNELMAGI